MGKSKVRKFIDDKGGSEFIGATFCMAVNVTFITSLICMVILVSPEQSRCLHGHEPQQEARWWAGSCTVLNEHGIRVPEAQFKKENGYEQTYP